jgi:CRP/FNR family transcriptional activator FtrB
MHEFYGTFMQYPASDWDFVRATPLFAALDEANFCALRAAAMVNRCPRNTLLGKEGERPRVLHILVEGAVELFATHSGQTATIEVEEPVTAIHLASIIGNAVAIKSARTVTSARTLGIPAETVREAFRRDAGFSRAVAEELAESSREIMRLLMNEKLRTSVERLAAWIAHSCTARGNTGTVELKFNKRILASRLGMAPENLSRNLAYLQRYGVHNSGRDIVVDDLRRLEAFAKPSALIDGATPHGQPQGDTAPERA